MHINHKNRTISFFLVIILIAAYLFKINLLTAHATLDELAAEAEARKQLPIQSNEIANWPVGPEISAQSAILMDANTGVILYAKNIHEKLYPASVTKILTCLLAIENGNLDDTVPFSHEAVFSVPLDGSKMGMDEGESITLEECLYGIMVASANEVANAVAEYVGGTIGNFIDMMNEYAAELGCTDSHFVNSNGLHDEDHYTSAYDLATISRVFFQNELLCKVSNTPKYHFESSATQPDDIYKNNKHKLINGEISYNGIVGGKTGYTDEARQTLVTCAEQNGMKLICVVLKEESPAQFTDTVELFDYGFQNFQVLNISENEEKFNIDNVNFFKADNDIFGNSKSILAVDTDSYVIVPNMADFSDLNSTIDYDATEENHVAQINYSYSDTYVGHTYVNLAANSDSLYEFNADSQNTTDISVERDSASSNENESTIFINVKNVLIGILVFAASIICMLVLRAFLINKSRSLHRKNRLKRKKHRRERISSAFDDFEF